MNYFVRLTYSQICIVQIIKPFLLLSCCTLGAKDAVLFVQPLLLAELKFSFSRWLVAILLHLGMFLCILVFGVGGVGTSTQPQRVYTSTTSQQMIRFNSTTSPAASQMPPGMAHSREYLDYKICCWSIFSSIFVCLSQKRRLQLIKNHGFTVEILINCLIAFQRWGVNALYYVLCVCQPWQFGKWPLKSRGMIGVGYWARFAADM